MNRQVSALGLDERELKISVMTWRTSTRRALSPTKSHEAQTRQEARGHEVGGVARVGDAR